VVGGPYQTITDTKQISVNPPLAPAVSTGQSPQVNTQPTGFTIMGISPLIIVIPGAAAGAFVVLKKKNMLDGISERINIAEKFSGMKERFAEMRQK
jgi:hypothetical protein